MNKIRIVNVKNGKFAEVTPEAIRQLKEGGHFKNFEIVNDNLQIQTPSTPQPVNVIVEEEIPTMPEPEQETAPGEFLDIENTEETPKKKSKK